MGIGGEENWRRLAAGEGEAMSQVSVGDWARQPLQLYAQSRQEGDEGLR